MKKSLTVVLGLMSATVLANEVKQPEVKQAEALPPALKLGVYDISSKVVSEVPGKKLSLKKRDIHQVCWTAFNMEFLPKNAITEIFVSPKQTKFSDQGSSVVTSKNKKTHTVTSHLPSHNNEFITRCWKFEKTDPLGKYTIEVRINDIQFPVLAFDVVK